MKMHYFKGTLTLSDAIEDKDMMNYVVVNKETNETKSISDLLDNIMLSDTQNKLVRIALHIVDTGKVINKMGSLHIARDKYGVDSYHINSLPLELQLDNLVECEIELYCEDYTDTEGTPYAKTAKVS